VEERSWLHGRTASTRDPIDDGADDGTVAEAELRRVIDLRGTNRSDDGLIAE